MNLTSDQIYKLIGLAIAVVILIVLNRYGQGGGRDDTPDWDMDDFDIN